MYQKTEHETSKTKNGKQIKNNSKPKTKKLETKDRKQLTENEKTKTWNANYLGHFTDCDKYLQLHNDNKNIFSQWKSWIINVIRSLF